MTSSANTETNNSYSQSQRTNLSTNTNITHLIYWINKSIRTITTFIYTYYTTQ